MVTAMSRHIDISDLNHRHGPGCGDGNAEKQHSNKKRPHGKIMRSPHEGATIRKVNKCGT